jgi:hypothetical protein
VDGSPVLVAPPYRRGLAAAMMYAIASPAAMRDGIG